MWNSFRGRERESVRKKKSVLMQRERDKERVTSVIVKPIVRVVYAVNDVLH